MTDYKVTYFKLAGSRGEEVRLALAIAGVPFDDIRVDRDAFQEFKADTPYGSMPVLEVAGYGAIGQTNAILRLIGRRHGMHPEEVFEAARHDSLLEAAEDLRHRISATMRLNDAEEKKAARQLLATDRIPLWGRSMERLIGEGPFVAGGDPSVADVKLYMMHRWIGSGMIDDIPSDALDGFPKLGHVAEGIASHPAVVAWYAVER